MLVNEHWQGDHHVFDLFVRVKLKRYRNDRLYEQEIAVRPVLTAWMDTATSCMVGWCISIIPMIIPALSEPLVRNLRATTPESESH